MSRIAIIGVGAMGCLFAGYLAPYADVTMIGHWAPQLDALRRGLTIITPNGEPIHRRVTATSDVHSVEPVSLALVLVKSYQTAQCAAEIRPLLQPGGMALTLQNGIGNRRALASQLGAKRVALGTTTEGATLGQLGVVRHAGRGVTILPLLNDERTDLIDVLAGVLRKATFNVRLSPDVQTRVWEKLAVNVAINPLTALIDAPNSLLIDNPAANQIARLAAKETAIVARAKGHSVDPQDAVSRTMAVAMATRQNVSSMLQDTRNGRPTELEAITGAVIKEGRQHGLSVPVNIALHHLLTIKLSGKDWTKAIGSLSPHIQPLFIELMQEGIDGNL